MRFPDYPKALLAIVVMVGALTACGKSHRDAEPTSRSTLEFMHSVRFMLDVCMIFNDSNERRMLVFNVENNTVVLSEMLGPPTNGEENVFTSEHLRKTQGTYLINEEAHTVRVLLGAQVSDYVAFMPGDQCLLVQGPLNSANLDGSWYAEADYSDADSD